MAQSACIRISGEDLGLRKNQTKDYQRRISAILKDDPAANWIT